MHLTLNKSQELVLEPTDETCNLSRLSLRDEDSRENQFEVNHNCLQQQQAKADPARQQQHQQLRTSSYLRAQSCIDEESDQRRQRRETGQLQRHYITGQRKTSVNGSTRSSSFGSFSLYDRSTICYRITDELILPQFSARDVVLRRCKQSEPLPFDDVYSESTLRRCRKIGEGVYSEVFMNKTASGRPIVLKIIPIDGDLLVNGEHQKNFDEILSEIVISQELSNLRTGINDKPAVTAQYMTGGFVEVVNVHCVKGRYPQHLIDLWELYRENKDSENDHPEIFDDEQLFIVFELANGGQDLEAFEFRNALQSYSAFLQVAITLAIAEKRFEFEHRDLHWGNILLCATDEKTVSFTIDGRVITIPTHGVKATIIDFTLSRMVVNGVHHFNDLSADDDLFSATGDYQFEIYRFMKTQLNNCWTRFAPYNNILWLHYVIDKMLDGARYKTKKTKQHRAAIDHLMQLRDDLLEYKSAADFVQCAYELN